MATLVAVEPTFVMVVMTWRRMVVMVGTLGFDRTCVVLVKMNDLVKYIYIYIKT